MSDTKVAPFEKEVVRLPDGRQLIYYRFPEAPPRAATSPAPAAPATPKER